MDAAVIARADLLQALAALTPQERMILSLSILYGYTTKQISQMLRCPHGTVSSKLHRSLQKLKKQMEKNSRIPKDFYEELISLQSASMQAWGEAKRTADFSIFAPYLEKLIDKTIQRCAYTDPGKDTYEVLLDEYEEGMDSASIDRVFSELKEGLVPLLDQILLRLSRIAVF